MDPSSLTTGVLAVFELSAKVLLTCYRLREQFKESQKDINAIIAEVETLSELSEAFGEFLEQVQGSRQVAAKFLSKKTEEALLAPSQLAIDGCHVILQEFALQLEPLTKSRLESHHEWPLKSSAIHEKLDIVKDHSDIIRINLDSCNTNFLSCQTEKPAADDPKAREKRDAVLRWYNKSDPEQNQKSSKEAREPNTGTWVFEDKSFRQWKESRSKDDQLIWLHGIPGAGKTVLCSTIIDHMQSYCVDRPVGHSPPRRSVYYYFDFSDNNKQNMANLLKSCIFQLISVKPGVSKPAEDLYNDRYMGANEPSLSELLGVFLAEAATHGTTFLMIDALDECPKQERIIFLKQIVGPTLDSNNIKLLLTSRREADIERGLPESVKTITIQDAVVDADIRTHVSSVISHDRTLRAMPLKTREEILEGIVSGARGMFRWAECQLETMKECLTPVMAREKLASMPKDLDQTYDRILSHIAPAHQPFVRSALHWLAFSTRPLLLEELAEAAAIRPELGHFDAETSRLLTNQMIIDLCGVLVSPVTIKCKDHDRVDWLRKKAQIQSRGSTNMYHIDHPEITIVYLSHYSVKEYMMREDSNPSRDITVFHTSEKLGNSYIAQGCLIYLLDFNRGRIASCLDFKKNPLLQYAACSWMDNWKLAEEDRGQVPLRPLYERLFSSHNQGAYINWLNIWNPDDRWMDGYLWPEDCKIVQSADLHPQCLYWAASLGDLALVKILVEQGADVTQREGYFESAFGAAAFAGHTKVMSYFLQKGLDPDMKGTTFANLLQIAVLGGSMSAVRLLINAGADTNARGGKWVTPLVAAASKQRDEILQLLIENGADLNTASPEQESALSQAAKAGNVPLVATLLRAGANANGSDSSVQAPTPLYSAVESGSLATVQMLLKHGADVNKPRNDDKAFGNYTYPLIAAASKGYIQIVRALLAAGADPNVKGCRSCTALSEAISSRDITTFRAVLDAGADPNMCSDSYTNCLHQSIKYREYAMAKLLLKAGGRLEAAMLIDAVAIHRNEPWLLDALLEWDGVDVDIFAEDAGSGGATALHAAAEAFEITTTSLSFTGNEAAMRLLLDRGAYANPISQQSYMTPLCQALSRGHTHLAKMLIEYGADVNRTIVHSPLELAVMWAHEEGGSWEAFEMVLDRGADINHNTEMVLYWPIKAEKPENVRLLVEKGCDVNRLMSSATRPRGGTSFGGRNCTPIQFAAVEDKIEMIQLLLQLGADINGMPGEHGTTLHYGLLSKQQKVVDFLLGNGAVVDDSIPGSSLICKAISNDLIDSIPKLVEAGADLNAQERSQSPLDMAFCRKDQGLVDLLRRHGARLRDNDIGAAKDAVEDIQQLKMLLDYGLNPNAHCGVRNSVIRDACLKTDTAAIALLVERGADLGSEAASNSFGEACAMGNMEMATFLLRHGMVAADGLARAAGVKNNTAMVDLLLGHGADIAANNGECFCAVGRVGCRKVMTRLLQEPMKPSERVHYLGVALQEAACCANSSFVAWLLDSQDAPINHLGPPYGSPLQATLSTTNLDNTTRIELVRVLIQRGANLNPPSVNKPADVVERERTRPNIFRMWKRDLSTTYAAPLTLSLRNGFGGSLKALAPVLLASGASANGIEGQYETPLQAAALSCPEMLAPLLDAGADVNTVGGRYGTALHAAASGHNVAGVRLLLARGADASISAGTYGSVLTCAARRGRWNRKDDILTTEIMRLLLDARADVHCTDGKYGSPVQLAARTGNIAALKLLAAHGADIRVQGGRWGNAYKAALKNLGRNKSVQWPVVSWLEQHYGREGWD